MTLEKFKIKERFNEIKSQLEGQKEAIPPQTQLTVSMLIQLVELIIIVFEERFTKKNSKNSSIPPSKGSTKKKRSRFMSKNKLPVIPDPLEGRPADEVIDIFPDYCHDCGLELEHSKYGSFESRQVLDIVIESYVTEYRVHHVDCPCCGHEQIGQFPSGIIAPLQYGPMIKALSISMLFAQMSSYSRTQVMMMELVGRSLSQATLVGFVSSLYSKLASWEKWATDQLLNFPVMHADETGFNLNGTNAWIHVLSNENIVLMNCHLKRGGDAINDIGIIPQYKGILVHDFWQAYYQYDELEHAACGAHLLRELEFIIDAHQHKWAILMRDVLLAALELVNKRKKDKLLDREYQSIKRRYRIAVTKGEKECPSPELSGKRGKTAKTKARNLLERFKDHEEEILRFARDPVVPFTNNIAERDLRMVKVKQNVSGFFRSETGAKAFCRIRSYLLTQWRKGIPPIQALKLAIEGNINYE